MKKCSILSAAIFVSLMVVALLFPVNSQAQIMNGGFEDGSNYWTAVGNTLISPFPVDGMPTNGTYFLQLNNGFPGGDDVLGNVGASGSQIETTLGISDLNAVEGSFVYQDASLTAGDTISFQYNFLTNEILPDGVDPNDFAFVSLSDGSSTFTSFVSVNSATFMGSTVGGFDNMTGVQTASIISPFSGTVRFGLGVVDVDNACGQSSVYIDNITTTSAPVPEPATMLLFGAGLVGLAGTRLRRKKAA